MENVCTGSGGFEWAVLKLCKRQDRNETEHNRTKLDRMFVVSENEQDVKKSVKGISFTMLMDELKSQDAFVAEPVLDATSAFAVVSAVRATVATRNNILNQCTDYISSRYIRLHPFCKRRSAP